MIPKISGLSESNKKNQALRFVQILIYIGIFSVFIYAARMMWSQEKLVDKDGVGILDINHKQMYKEIISFHFYNINTAVSFFSLGILIAGSAITIGCLIGFIFAIPKSAKNSNTNLTTASHTYVANDNLVEVSDWLTKIIVGVSLTQLTHIPKYLESIGQYIAPSIGGTTTGEVAAESIVVYFLICGFLLAYLWTRLFFAELLENSEKEENIKINQ